MDSKYIIIKLMHQATGIQNYSILVLVSSVTRNHFFSNDYRMTAPPPKKNPNKLNKTKKPRKLKKLIDFYNNTISHVTCSK